MIPRGHGNWGFSTEPIGILAACEEQVKEQNQLGDRFLRRQLLRAGTPREWFNLSLILFRSGQRSSHPTVGATLADVR